ncbi:unnamed protein product [Amoebophrya sp. A120]|nr:unnamed protein product [Amoebophrya sp. A120]|eukprot:GSA120T00002050001.1
MGLIRIISGEEVQATIPAGFAKRLPLVKRLLEGDAGRVPGVGRKQELNLDSLGQSWGCFLLALNKISPIPFLTGAEEDKLCKQEGVLNLDGQDLNYFWFSEDPQTGALSTVPTVYEVCEFFGGGMKKIQRSHDLLFGTRDERALFSVLQAKDRDQMQAFHPSTADSDEIQQYNFEDAGASGGGGHPPAKRPRISTGGTSGGQEPSSCSAGASRPDEFACSTNARFVKHPREIINIHPDPVTGAALPVVRDPAFQDDGHGCFPQDVRLFAPAKGAKQVAHYDKLASLREAREAAGPALAAELLRDMEFDSSMPKGVRWVMAGGSVVKALTQPLASLGGSDLDLYLVIPEKGVDGNYTGVEPTNPTEIWRRAVLALYANIQRDACKFKVDTIHRTAHAVTLHLVERRVAKTLNVHEKRLAPTHSGGLLWPDDEEEQLPTTRIDIGGQWYCARHEHDLLVYRVQLMSTYYPSVFEILRNFDLPCCQVACEVMPQQRGDEQQESFYTTARGKLALTTRSNLLAQDDSVCILRARKYWLRGFGFAIPTCGPSVSAKFDELRAWYSDYAAQSESVFADTAKKYRGAELAEADRVCDSEFYQRARDETDEMFRKIILDDAFQYSQPKTPGFREAYALARVIREDQRALQAQLAKITFPCFWIPLSELERLLCFMFATEEEKPTRRPSTVEADAEGLSLDHLRFVRDLQAHCSTERKIKNSPSMSTCSRGGLMVPRPRNWPNHEKLEYWPDVPKPLQDRLEKMLKAMGLMKSSEAVNTLASESEVRGPAGLSATANGSQENLRHFPDYDTSVAPELQAMLFPSDHKKLLCRTFGPADSGGGISVKRITGGVGFYKRVYAMSHRVEPWLYFTDNIDHILYPGRESIPLDGEKYWACKQIMSRVPIPSHLQTLHVYSPAEAAKALWKAGDSHDAPGHAYWISMRSKVGAKWHVRQGMPLDLTAREILGLDS